MYRRFEYYQEPGQGIPRFINSKTDKALIADGAITMEQETVMGLTYPIQFIYQIKPLLT